MNYFSFTLSGKHFICHSILNDSSAWQSNLGCRSLFFITMNTLCQSLLACKVSFEKSADSLIGTPLQVTLCLSLAAFKILSLSSWLVWLSGFLIRNLAGQKGLERSIQSDEKQGPTTQIILSRKAIIQNGRADKVLPRQGKAKGVNHHQAIIV